MMVFGIFSSEIKLTVLLERFLISKVAGAFSLSTTILSPEAIVIVFQTSTRCVPTQDIIEAKINMSVIFFIRQK